MSARHIAEYMLPDGLPRPRLRGWLHLGAVPVAVALGVLLVVLAPDGRATLAAAIYALAVVGLFATSGIYHRGRWEPAVRAWLQRVDHAMIFILIAGTYTPICLLAIGGTMGTVLLAVVWSAAAAGAAVNLLPWSLPRWVAIAIYLLMGWAAVVAVPGLVAGVGIVACLLVLLGGLLYTTGAVVYALRRPDPLPSTFGYHEIFHACTIVAAAAHYAVIAFWVLPSA
ncbi:MAG: hemolysin III family protein [Actinomycetota bacterium]|nr:hemolysin III family protein [Actinomycetota bacterium]